LGDHNNHRLECGEYVGCCCGGGGGGGGGGGSADDDDDYVNKPKKLLGKNTNAFFGSPLLCASFPLGIAHD